MRSSVLEEIKHLNSKQRRNTLSRYADAVDDKDDILDSYRRIETCFRRLQVSELKALVWCEG
jgi:hypothetical protein